MADRSKGRFDRVGGTNALPVLDREVEEAHLVLVVLDQLAGSLRILHFTARQELVESLVGIVSGFRYPGPLRKKSICLFSQQATQHLLACHDLSLGCLRIPRNLALNQLKPLSNQRYQPRNNLQGISCLTMPA